MGRYCVSRVSTLTVNGRHDVDALGDTNVPVDDMEGRLGRASSSPCTTNDL